MRFLDPKAIKKYRYSDVHKDGYRPDRVTAEDIREAVAEALSDTPPAIVDAPGVYLLVNSETKRVYVGRSIHIPTRIRTHLSQIRTGKHQNKLIANDGAAHGVASFKACVLTYAVRQWAYLAEHAAFTLLRQMDNYNIQHMDFVARATLSQVYFDRLTEPVRAKAQHVMPAC